MKGIKKLGLILLLGLVSLVSIVPDISAWGRRGGWRGRGGFGVGIGWGGGWRRRGWGWRRPWYGRPWGYGWGWRRGIWWPSYYGAYTTTRYVRPRNEVWLVINDTDQEIRIKPRDVAPVTLPAGTRSKVARGTNDEFYVMPQSGIALEGSASAKVITIYEDQAKDDGSIVIETSN